MLVLRSYSTAFVAKPRESQHLFVPKVNPTLIFIHIVDLTLTFIPTVGNTIIFIPTVEPILLFIPTFIPTELTFILTVDPTLPFVPKVDPYLKKYFASDRQGSRGTVKLKFSENFRNFYILRGSKVMDIRRNDG